MASGLAYDGKPNINDLRLMFDSSRYASQSESNQKRNFHSQMHSSAILEASATAGKGSSFADAKPSSFDENIFEVARLPTASGANRNVDFDRVKQKFEKPTSLNLKTSHTKPIVRLGQPNGNGGGSSKRTSADVDLLGVAQGSTTTTTTTVGQEEDGVDGSAGSSGFAMTTSMNLDELKVSDDEVSLV